MHEPWIKARYILAVSSPYWLEETKDIVFESSIVVSTAQYEELKQLYWG